jgi:hypothetical protein
MAKYNLNKCLKRWLSAGWRLLGCQSPAQSITENTVTSKTWTMKPWRKMFSCLHPTDLFPGEFVSGFRDFGSVLTARRDIFGVNLESNSGSPIHLW